jgi:hypothetical protein
MEEDQHSALINHLQRQRREHRESAKLSLWGDAHPFVFGVYEPLPGFCFPLSTLRLFQTHALSEARRLPDKLKHVLSAESRKTREWGRIFVLKVISPGTPAKVANTGMWYPLRLPKTPASRQHLMKPF